jgi:hypothetical protein
MMLLRRGELMVRAVLLILIINHKQSRRLLDARSLIVLTKSAAIYHFSLVGFITRNENPFTIPPDGFHEVIFQFCHVSLPARRLIFS